MRPCQAVSENWVPGKRLSGTTDIRWVPGSLVDELSYETHQFLEIYQEIDML